MNKSLYIVGFRASGKSTLGRILADEYNMNFCDLDALFISQFGDVSEFVAEHGWSVFRDKEAILLKTVFSVPTIVATGGGVVERLENRQFLKTKNVLFLDTPFDVLQQRLRVSNESHRPRLDEQKSVDQEIYEHWVRRYDWYKAVATNVFVPNNTFFDTNQREALKQILL